jgi:hypothetical protein
MTRPYDKPPTPNSVNFSVNGLQITFNGVNVNFNAYILQLKKYCFQLQLHYVINLNYAYIRVHH